MPLNILRRISGRGNSLRWAINCECKEMVLKYGRSWLWGMKIHRALDIASGKNEELCRLAPHAKEYHFLDNFLLPPPRRGFCLHRQAAGEKMKIESSSMDLVMTNGSFDHFTDEERLNSFLEVERILRPGGLFLFACEYHDFADDGFFRKHRRIKSFAESTAVLIPTLILLVFWVPSGPYKSSKMTPAFFPVEVPFGILLIPKISKFFQAKPQAA